MSENKFILQLKGEQTPKSVVEVKNNKLVAPFTNVPNSTDVVGSIIDVKDSSVVGAKGAQNWKLDGSSLVATSSLSGDGADYTGEFNASGSGLWINANYTLPATIFNAGTKWVLKLCGKNLLTTSGNTVDFTLVVKVGNTHITSKSFTVAEGANAFCRQMIIDFSESEQAIIKAQAGTALTLQLLCVDTNASATIYNGMTVLTALQRRVDSDAVASNTSTFDDLETRLDNIETELGDTFVKTDGASIMTAPLKFMAGSMRGAVGPYLNGVGFWKLDSQANLTLIATISDSQFLPTTTNAITLGSSARKWKDLYLAGKAYIATINNGTDINVPTYGGTMVVADWGKEAQLGMFLRLDRDLHPVWETVTISLSDLTDVTISSASSGQVLTYNGSKWVNQAVSTPTVNYSINGGNYTAGTGTYAITRFSLMLQKADGTWEKPTDTSANYSQATNKTVNTNGFLLNQILYYNNTGGVSGGQLTGLNKVYSKHASVPMSYSTNCGTTPGWALGTWIYLVGTLGADGLFYLDTTQWWSDALPITNDGKLYIRLGPASSSTSDTVALLEDRPIFYNDGNGVKEYYPSGNVSVGTSVDAEIIGALTQNSAAFSGFSATQYLGIPGILDLSKPFELVIGAKFDNTTTYTQTLLSALDTNIFFEYSPAGTLTISFYTDSSKTTYGSVAANTDHLIKFSWDGSDYKLFKSTDGGETYTQMGLTISSSVAISNTRIILGKTLTSSDFAGTIDLTKAYFKSGDNIFWRGLDASGLHQRVATGHEVIAFQAPTAQNNYTWYRKYADGWVEQGGQTNSTTDGSIPITLPVEMADANYVPLITGQYITNTATASNNGASKAAGAFSDRTVTGFNLWKQGAAPYGWEVKGVAA